MKKFLLAVMVFVGSVAWTGVCRAETKFFVKAEPVSFLISPKLDGFNVSDGYTTETLSGTASWLPMITGGWEISQDQMVYSVGGGAGYLYNGAFHAATVTAEGSARYKITDLVEVGPHALVLYFISPSWGGTSDIDLSSSVGFGGGLALAVKLFRDDLKVTASADYVSGKFKVTPGLGFTASSSKLDYSGALIKIGVQYAF